MHVSLCALIWRSLDRYSTTCVLCSLGGLNWFRIKVALSIHRSLFLSVRGVAGIHIVGRNGSCYSTEARHGDLEELCIKFLGFGWNRKSEVNSDKMGYTRYGTLWVGNRRFTLWAKDSKIPQKSLRERCSSSSEVTPKLAHPLGKQ